MADRESYQIEFLSYSATSIVWLGDVKVAIVFPPLHDGGPYQIYPHPGTFPTLSFAGLPSPLRPEFMPFQNLDAVRAFLGMPSEAEERGPESLAA